MDAFSERCTMLAEAWRWWAAMLADLDSDKWGAPTRLPEWDVAALVVHHSGFVRGLGYLAAAVGVSVASIPQDPLQHTARLLASMAETVPFIEAATGRSSVPVLPVLR